MSWGRGVESGWREREEGGREKKERKKVKREEDEYRYLTKTNIILNSSQFNTIQGSYHFIY